MHLSLTDNVAWAFGAALETLLLLLALRRGLYRRFPVFTLYVALVVLSEPVLWFVYNKGQGHLRLIFVAYYLTQCILLLARGGVVAEICRDLLSPYPGIWKVCRGCLLTIAVVLLAFAAAAAYRTGASTAVATGERGLELVVVGVLLFAVAFCRYYEIVPDQVTAFLALGLGLYSAIQVANNTLIFEWLLPYVGWWQKVRQLSYPVVVFVWLFALRNPLPEARPAPALLDAGVYDEFVPQVNMRLRELNARLQEILK
jgi:hypothetical protein